MSWTAQQVGENLTLHKACPAGAAWAKGKDSEAMWASTDEFAPPYLLWWAIQNAGQPNWKSVSGVISVLKTIVEIGCRYSPTFADSLQHKLSLLEDNGAFKQQAVGLYYSVEQAVAWEDRHHDALTQFQAEVIGIIRELKASA